LVQEKQLQPQYNLALKTYVSKPKTVLNRQSPKEKVSKEPRTNAWSKEDTAYLAKGLREIDNLQEKPKNRYAFIRNKVITSLKNTLFLV
jgi:hypothetical protein